MGLREQGDRVTDKGRLLSRNFHLDGGVWSGSDILYYDATTGKWWADSASTGHTHDHGGLTGLSDDDHTQYLLITGSRAMSGNLDLGGNLIVSNGSATGIFVSDSGNVGIGTTAPGSALEVNGDIGFDYGATNNSILMPGSIGTSSMKHTQSNGEINFKAMGAFIFNSQGSVVTFQTAGVERARVSSTGLGIGVTPGVELHVQMTNARARLYATGTNDPILWLGGGISSTARYGQVGLDYSASEVYLAYGSGGSNRAIQIDSSQRVGLGKSPGYNFHVYTNDTATDAAIVLEQDSTGDCMMGFLLSATRQWSIGIDNSDSDSFKISAEALFATSTIITVKTTGDTGFGGLTNPQEDVHADDTVRADQRFNHNGTDGGTSNPTVTWTDGGGQSHEVTIGGGIVTSWLIDSSEQLI